MPLEISQIIALAGYLKTQKIALNVLESDKPKKDDAKKTLNFNDGQLAEGITALKNDGSDAVVKAREELLKDGLITSPVVKEEIKIDGEKGKTVADEGTEAGTGAGTGAAKETLEQKTTRETAEKKAADEKTATTSAAAEAPKTGFGLWGWGSVVVGALAVIGGLFGSEKKGMSILAAIGGILLTLPWLKPAYNWFRNITEAATNAGTTATEQATEEAKVKVKA